MKSSCVNAPSEQGRHVPESMFPADSFSQLQSGNPFAGGKCRVRFAFQGPYFLIGENVLESCTRPMQALKSLVFKGIRAERLHEANMEQYINKKYEQVTVVARMDNYIFFRHFRHGTTAKTIIHFCIDSPRRWRGIVSDHHRTRR